MHSESSPTLADVWVVVRSFLVLVVVLAGIAVAGVAAWAFCSVAPPPELPRSVAPARPGQPPPAHR